ncbi:MAG: glycosyltransferase, partial [Deltaproteobacteria bacterium]|nr:glycosyltransferase [Deltaproteobacteria bacterium]
GIPLLEAMACGIPVVCSDIEPLIEVAGGAAHLVDPLSVDGMAQGMLKVLTDKALMERLVRDGLRRAGDFSWKKTATDTLSLISPRRKGS